MKTKLNFLAAILLIIIQSSIINNQLKAQGVGISETGTTADSSAMLDVISTDKGLLIPRMTQAQRDGISSPANGLLIYQIDATPGFYYFNGTIWVQAIGPIGPTGPSGDIGATGATGPTGAVINEYAVYEDQKIAGTDGGDFISGAWQTRTLNTTVASMGPSISRSGNVITLSAGAYRIVASAPARYVGGHKIRFRNISDNTTALLGTGALADRMSVINNRSFIDGIITIALTKDFELQHSCAISITSYGFGTAVALGENEVYTRVYIQKIE